MKVNSQSRFFKWLGPAAFGAMIGLAAGALSGLVIGGGLGGWFWYDMRNDGFNAVSDDTENLFGFLVTVGLAIVGAIVGLIAGGIGGLAISSFVSAIRRSPTKQ